jgi:hypothetical protein
MYKERKTLTWKRQSLAHSGESPLPGHLVKSTAPLRPLPSLTPAPTFPPIGLLFTYRPTPGNFSVVRYM